MGILARLLNGVDLADVGVLLALVWLVVRLEWTRSETAAAHAGITRILGDLKRDLTREVDGLKRDVETLDARVRGVEVAFARADQRLEALEHGFGTLANRFGTLANRFGTLENRFGTLENRFGILANRFGTLEGAILPQAPPTA